MKQVPESASSEKPRCPNCGKKIKASFKYCPKCGQRLRTHKTSLGVLIIDMIREEFHLSNKYLRTMRNLLLQPGALTQDYIAGKKKSMLSPTKLFFWSGFLFVALLIPSLEDLQLAKGDGSGPIQFNFDGQTEEDLATLRQDAGIFGRIWIDAIQEANEHPDLFIQNSLRKIPIVLLLITPVFALLLKVVYYRRKMYYLEHLVFLLHFHGYTFLVFSMFLLLYLVLGSLGGFGWWGILVMAVYFYLSLRRVYQHSWGNALWRTGVLFLIYLITVPLALMLLSLVMGLLL